VLLPSRDGGKSWAEVDVCHPVSRTTFKGASGERQLSWMSCATNCGAVWTSRDVEET